MRTVIIVHVDDDKMTEYFSIMAEVHNKLSSVGRVSYSTNDSSSTTSIELSPIPDAETLAALEEQIQPTPMSPEEQEALSTLTPEQRMERERLKAMSVTTPQRPPMTKEEQPASVTFGVDPRSEQTRRNDAKRLQQQEQSQQI